MLPEFGKGIYTATDASEILGISYQKISYWFRQYIRGAFESQSNFHYFFDSDDLTAVNFYTLIELYVFDFFRQKKIPVNKIITAHREIGTLLETPYPFCHTEVLMSSGRNILLNYKGILLNASPGFQQEIAEYVLPYSQKIEFQNQMAYKYFPLGKEKSIVVNPENQYGSPTFEGTGMKVSTIAGLLRAGELHHIIRKIYDLTEEQLEDAIQYLKVA